jgi:hypothetical protein
MRWNVVEELRTKRWALRLLHIVPILALLSLFTVTGLRGVDFGDHWDEAEWHIQPARDMVASGVFLPHRYIYPAFTKWLELAPAIPAGLTAGLDGPKMQAAMSRVANAPEFHLRVRDVFIVVSGLAIVWVYGAALALRRKWWEGLLAAAGLGLSWEYAYHSRWVTADCILTQFSALTVLLLAVHHRTKRTGWLYAAAIAAGLGTGTKYTGVFLLVLVMFASVGVRPARAWPKWLGHAFRLAALCATAFGAYLVTTPGTLLEPFAFINETKLISSVYSGSHYGYTVTAGWPHWKVALTFLSVSFFSPYKVVALPLFASIFLGAFAWVRSDRRAAALLICFPVLLLAFFCGRYTIAVVRNYLMLTPFLTLLSARGVAEVFARIPVRWGRRALGGVLVVAMAANAAWLIRAGESIRRLDANGEVRDAIAYVARHGGTRFRLSPRVRALAAEQQLTLPPNVTEGGDPQVVVFFPKAEGPDPRQFKTNDPWLTEAVFGPGEVDFNWYSTWGGRDRVVAMTIAKAKGTGVLLAN